MAESQTNGSNLDDSEMRHDDSFELAAHESVAEVISNVDVGEAILANAAVHVQAEIVQEPSYPQPNDGTLDVGQMITLPVVNSSDSNHKAAAPAMEGSDDEYVTAPDELFAVRHHHSASDGSSDGMFLEIPSTRFYASASSHREATQVAVNFRGYSPNPPLSEERTQSATFSEPVNASVYPGYSPNPTPAASPPRPAVVESVSAPSVLHEALDLAAQEEVGDLPAEDVLLPVLFGNENPEEAPDEANMDNALEFLQPNNEEYLLDDTDEDDDSGESEYELDPLPIEDSDLSEEDDVDDQAVVYPGSITFDQSVPAEHRYLGGDMEQMSGRTIYEEGSVITLPALSIPGVVLIPGQTLPLHVFHPQAVAMLRTVVDGNKTFCFVKSRGYGYEGGRVMPDIARVGTTAEVFSISPDENEQETVKAITIGRQRFKVVNIRRQLGGVMMATVEILPEVNLGNPLVNVTPWSQLKPAAQIPEQDSRHDNDGKNNSYRKKNEVLSKIKSAGKWDSKSFHHTAWPGFVYKLYCQDELMRQVKDEVLEWGESTHQTTDNISSPDQLSYWVAENLPLCDEDKLILLEMNSSIQRLKYELHLLQKCASLCCRSCGHAVCKRSDVFSLSEGGPMGTYVNPHGHVHETLTVYKVKSRAITLWGRPSTEHSWFPGYAWTIANCRECRTHKGWKFTATTSSMKPQKFYGLSRNGLIPGIAGNVESSYTVNR